MRVSGLLRRPWNLRLMVIIGVALMGLILIPGTGVKTVAQTQSARSNADGGRYVFAELAEKVMPSVVTVYVKRDMRKEMDPQTMERLKEFQKQFQDDPLLKQFIPFTIPSPDSPDQQGAPDGDQWMAKGSGSGVVVSPDGYILTNWHVVGDKKNNPEVRVVLADNTELTGKDIKIVESSPLADLALLKVNRTGLHAVEWGDSDSLRIGERVAAIGSPLDLRETITQGIICAKHRNIDTGVGMGTMLQTDAVINPGSSGGALVNLDGQLIGINRLITTPFQGREAWSGYGFAIPSNDAKTFVDQVLKSGKVVYGWLGVGVANEFNDSDKMRGALGIDKTEKGALIMNVTPGSPAAEAQLEMGDFIVSADGKPITNYNDLVSYVARRPVGAIVKLTVLRPQAGGTAPRRETVNVKIAERPTQDKLDEMLRGGGGEGQMESPKPKARAENSLGLKFDPAPYSQKGVHGLKITQVDPNSVGARNGLSEGDVLLEINKMPIRSEADIQKALDSRKDQPHLIKILHNGRPAIIAIDQISVKKK